MWNSVAAVKGRGDVNTLMNTYACIIFMFKWLVSDRTCVSEFKLAYTISFAIPSHCMWVQFYVASHSGQ